MAKNLTVGSPIRLIVAFTLPLLIGNLFQQLYSVADTIVVGRLLGVDALAAVGASSSLQFLLIGFAMGASTGLAIPIARAFGAGDVTAMRRAVGTGAWVSTGIAVAITLIGTFGARTMLTWMGTPPELLDQSVTFLSVLFAGAAATVAFNYLSAVIRALGDSTTPLWFLIIACVLNVILVVLFVGACHWGVGGAAAATLVAQGVSAVMCLVLIWWRMPILHLKRDDFRIRIPELRHSASLGGTMGFQMSIVAIGAAVVQFGVNRLGAQSVAAFTAALRVDQVVVTPLASVGLAMTTFVAQNAGALKWERILTGVFRAGVLTVIMSLVLGACAILFGTQLVWLFVGDGQPEILAMAHQYLMISGALYWTLSLLFLIRGSIQGLGSTSVPMAASVMELAMRSWVGLFLIERIGFLGVSLSAPLAWAGALVPLVAAWYFQRRRLRGLAARSGARAATELSPALA